MGLNKNNSIISYAVISAKFESDKGKNIILTLIPLIEYLLITIYEKTVTTEELSKAFSEMYGYKIPLAVIDELLKILDKNKKIEKLKNEEYLIIKENIAEYDEIENYNKKLRTLIMDVDYFLKKRGKNIPSSEITNELFIFIIKNAIDFNDFILRNSNFEDLDSDNTNVQDELIEFLIEERKNDTPNYKFLNEIYYGVVVANIITNWGEDSEESINTECTIENVLVDSNFVFRLLDLQTKTEHLVANDTYEMLKNKKCNFWIYDDTIQQISDTLHNVAKRYNATTNKVLTGYNEKEFAGVLSACMRRNLTPSKIESIITKLEDSLKSKGINRFEDFIVTESEIEKDDISDLYKWKQRSHESLVHDLILIEIVKRKRPRATCQMRQAKWWLLTDDIKLTKWNTAKWNSRGVPQCITESQVATVLWLNEPKTMDACGLLPTVVALRNRNLIDSDEYEKITKNIEELSRRCDDEKSQEKLALIFSLRLLSVNDLIDTSEDNIDSLLQKKMDEADEYISQLESDNERMSERNQSNEDLLEKYKEKIDIVTSASHKYQSLFDDEREDNIESLRKLRDYKTEQLDDAKEQLFLLREKLKKQLVACKVVAVLIIVVLAVLSFVFAPKIQKWFSKNEWLYGTLGVLLTCLISVLGLKFNFDTFLNQCFIKVKLQKDYIAEIDKLENKMLEIEEEISNIKVQINKKLEVSFV